LNACVLILFEISTMFILCFGSWGAQTIHYFELKSLVEGPFSARFNLSMVHQSSSNVCDPLIYTNQN
jgi:hypothetical protein